MTGLHGILCGIEEPHLGPARLEHRVGVRGGGRRGAHGGQGEVAMGEEVQGSGRSGLQGRHMHGMLPYAHRQRREGAMRVCGRPVWHVGHLLGLPA
jgi:hypothetical protein